MTLQDMPLKDVAPIFERINSTGTRLTIVDLMRAATWSKNFDLVDSIEEILEDLAEKDYGKIDEKALLRNISAAAGGDFTSASIDRLRNHGPTKLKRAVGESAKAYKKTADFLSAQIGIPNSSLIPYVNQVVVLAELFRRVPSPNAKQRDAIKAWFWGAAVAGYYSGWNTGMMAGDLYAIKKFAAGKSTQEAGKSTQIEIEYRTAASTIWSSRSFRGNNAHSKVLALALAAHTPRDLLTGAKIDIGKVLAWENSREFHHFFPQAYMRDTHPEEESGLLANIVLLTSESNKKIRDQAPSDYLKEAEKQLGTEFAKVLASNLISDAALAAAKVDDWKAFIKERAVTIHNAGNALITKNSGP